MTTDPAPKLAGLAEQFQVRVRKLNGLLAPLDGLSDLERKLGRNVEAERLLRQALTIRETALGAGHAEVGKLRRKLGALLRELGRPDDADALLRDTAARP